MCRQTQTRQGVKPLQRRTFILYQPGGYCGQLMFIRIISSGQKYFLKLEVTLRLAKKRRSTADGSARILKMIAAQLQIGY